MMYVTAFLTAWGIAVIGCAALVGVARYLPSRRVEARRPVSHPVRLGGVAMVAAFVIALLVHPNFVPDTRWVILLIALGGVVLVGLWDDYRVVTWRTQLAAHVWIAMLLFIGEIRITAVSHPFRDAMIVFSPDTVFSLTSFVLTILWVVGIMNVMNWLDGVDGLGGMVALVAGGTIFATALLPHVHQPPVAIAAAALMGATGGFLVWNWAPSRIIAGTTGAFFWGVVVASLAIIAGAKIATTLLVMIVPLVDAVWVIFSRLRAGVSPFAPDRRHLHYRLADRGWSSRHIALLYAGLIGAVAFGSVHATVTVKATVVVTVAIIMIGLLLWVEHTQPTVKSSSR